MRYLKSQGIELVDLDFTHLSSAIKKRDPLITSKETYSILKVLQHFFSGLSTSKDLFIENHPNFSDIKKIIVANYLLNDIILGLIIKDKVEEEVESLMRVLDKLSKDTGLKINKNDFNEIFNKLAEEQEKENIIKKCRAVFQQQLKNLRKMIAESQYSMYANNYNK